MSVFLIDSSMDAALNEIKNNVTERYICAGNPTTRAAAISAALATLTGLSGSSFTGPADGDTSGRKLTKNAETGDGIDSSGTADTICYCSASVLIWRVNLSAPQALTSGGTVDVGAHKHEIADAA
jgi:hypothetical protein